MKPTLSLRAAALLSFSFLLAAAAPNETREENFDWPQWRGPLRDGISKEANWSPAGKAEDLWRVEVGLGYASVAVANGRLYTTGFDETAGIDTVWCLDPETGAKLWSHEYPGKVMKHLHEGGTLSTPTVDGEDVYVINREGLVHCFDAAKGEVKWKADALKLAEGELGTWGFSASPIVDGDELILNVGKIAVLDKQTGKLKWASKNYGHSYSTPALFDLDGTPAIAVFNSDGLAVIERDGGKQRYFHEWKTRYDINAATPQVIGDKIFISSGLGRGCALLEMSKSEAGEEAFEVLWENKAMSVKMSGSVLIDGHLYGFDEAVLKCIDLEGKDSWVKRGIGNGALSAADGKLIIMSADGELIVAKAAPGGYEELSRAKVIDDDKVYWTVPVLVNGRIYCRGNRGTLVCRDHRG